MVEKIEKLIPIETTHLVISQNILRYFIEYNLTGGRTFDVLMYRYPIDILQKKLDGIYDIHQQSNTLNEYRAPNSIIINEDKGLKKARKIVTPHRKISELFFQKSILLNCSINIEKNITLEKGLKVLFPGSSLARKGAFEVRKIVQEFELPLVIKKDAMETKSFWNNVYIEYADSKDIFKNIELIIYPAYI
ncbi:hypothetical protein ETU09_04595 [Apibacter muscae]|uniref:Uncharacterized protein n=1 Tax=Apibacter muscae TaxID=2509004 RepID=A0A563DH17_9FLAO|nr:hypothetical protein [Apibacter muscae]TWP29124.1 hypothetical protein ETU09_04595 [Apibacter muscae]